MESIKQAGQIERGELKPAREFNFTPADIKEIRSRMNKSQAEFALMIGAKVSTLQNWEQGRRLPKGPARALLKIAAEFFCNHQTDLLTGREIRAPFV